MRTDDSVRARPPRRGAADAAPLARLRARRASRCRSRRARPLLACGAELKSTFCLAKGERAWVGHHIGDLENCETLRSFREGIEHFERLFAVAPEVVAHDLHPDYLSTAYALEREGVELVGVQHHHAHLAACLAEHGETGPGVGAIFDGTGYGRTARSGAASCWSATCAASSAPGTCWPVRLPGGDARRSASRGGWRARGCAARDGEAAPPLPGSRTRRAGRRSRSWPRRGVASPLTTSMGRLFDAVAALCGLRTRGHLRGTGGGRARGGGRPGERGAYPLPLLERRRRVVLDARETVARRARRRARAACAASVVARALPQRASRARRPTACAPRPSARGSRRSCSPAACSRTGCCSSATRERARARGLRVLVAASGCRPTTAASPTARRRWRRRAALASLPGETIVESRGGRVRGCVWPTARVGAVSGGCPPGRTPATGCHPRAPGRARACGTRHPRSRTRGRRAAHRGRSVAMSDLLARARPRRACGRAALPARVERDAAERDRVPVADVEWVQVAVVRRPAPAWRSSPSRRRPCSRRRGCEADPGDSAPACRRSGPG